MNFDDVKDVAYVPQDDLYNKKIQPVEAPGEEIGIDLERSVLNNIIDAVEVGKFDSSALNSFTQVSRTRNEMFSAIDYMAQDSTLSSVLETYAEDATETNDSGQVVWAESPDSNVLKFVNYLLNAMNVDKNVYRWVKCLCTYGDVYLRLYRESEYDDILFRDKYADRKAKRKKSANQLNEDLVIKAYSKNDNYIHYAEMVANPAQMFELTRFGKTAAYIKTQVAATNTSTDLTFDTSNQFLNRYKFNKNDVELYEPTEFVHGSLDNSNSRISEEVELFLDNNDTSLTYNVRSGESLLMDVYKVWRQLMLLENSVLLSRVTQSSIVRVIGVEVGDMAKESVQPHLLNIKQLIEQKAALDVGKSMNEYTNPGPIVNNVYIPTRNGQGVISTTQIGGDVNMGELVDLDWYNNKLFGGLRVPKQHFGFTDDATGFNGGTSLSLLSSRYAKMIKRIQNIICQMITDMINLILIDTHNESYINKFSIRMQAPTTQEEVDRRDNLSNKVGLIRDIMDIAADIETPTTKLKMLKSLLGNTINDPEVIQLLQDEIDSMELAAQEEEDMAGDDASTEEDTSGEGEDLSGLFDDGGSSGGRESSSSESEDDIFADLFGDEDSADANSDSADTADNSDDSLPTPAELDIGDVSDSSNPELG